MIVVIGDIVCEERHYVGDCGQCEGLQKNKETRLTRSQGHWETWKTTEARNRKEEEAEASSMFK